MQTFLASTGCSFLQSVVLVSLIVALATPVHAAAPVASPSVATLGQTYPIAEPDFLKAIEAKLKAKEASGELAKLQQEAIARSQRSIMSPRPVDGIRTTVEPRTFRFDPTITVSDNLTTPDGRLIVAAGTRVNPLEKISLSRPLLFLDARDPEQVKMAERLHAQRQGNLKTILTAGSYIDLMRSWKRQVYYDQGGKLTAKLGIAQVPALVEQDGLALRVSEMKVMR